jgi:hypothetical protein
MDSIRKLCSGVGPETENSGKEKRGAQEVFTPSRACNKKSKNRTFNS